MTFLRNLGHDLVDKRLWPVAVALILALIAVPVLLGRSSAPAEPVAAAPASDPSAAVAAAPGAAGSVLPGQAVVSLDQPLTGGARYRSGPVRNPFVQQHLPKVDTASTSLVAASAATSATSAGSTSGGSGAPGGAGLGSGLSDDIGGPTFSPAPSSDGPSGTTPGSTKAPSSPGAGTDTNDIYRVSVRFGEAGNQRTIRDIARLTPLPSSSDPFFVFLGVLKDGKTAVFLVSSDATVETEGDCKPRKDNCETVQLKAGETAFFDLSLGTAGVSAQYEMNLLTVRKRDAASAAVATKSRARESKAGRDILRAAVKQTDLGFDYIPRLGVLKPAEHDNVKDDGRGYVPASVLQGSLPEVDPVTEEPAEAGAPAADAQAEPVTLDAGGYMPAQPVPDAPPPAAAP